ncbi:MAG: hypothetical protein Q9181_000108 [Wetmoreana brouardii]
MDNNHEETRQPAIIGITVMLLFLSTAAVVLRLILRRWTGLGLWYDDYTVVIALGVNGSLHPLTAQGLRYGLGRHAAEVGQEKVVAYSKKDLYAFEVIWTLTVPVIKTSLLLLYNRIFPIRPVLLATYAVGFFVITWLLWAGISTIAQCVPVAYFWNRSIPGGHCINSNVFYIAAGAVNVFTSFAIIAIPIPIIWRLQQITTAQKLGFIFIFCLGGFVCIVSIIRLVYVGRISADDITWTDAWGGLWSSMEVSLDVVAANLPVIAPGFLKLTRQRKLSWAHLRSILTRGSETRNVRSESLENLKKRGEDVEMERMVGIADETNAPGKLTPTKAPVKPEMT